MEINNINEQNVILQMITYIKFKDSSGDPKRIEFICSPILAKLHRKVHNEHTVWSNSRKLGRKVDNPSKKNHISAIGLNWKEILINNLTLIPNRNEINIQEMDRIIQDFVFPYEITSEELNEVRKALI